MKSNFPVFQSTISEDDNDAVEVQCIAIVDRPAVEYNFLQFKEVPSSFAITNEDERIVTGVAMVANMPIYRKDPETGEEYYTFFDANTIAQIAQRFFRKKYNFNLNLNHDDAYKPEDVYIFESWIVDRAKGKTSMEQFKDLEDGSWLISVKVDNPKVWEQIKAGEFKGFSVEGLFKMQRVQIKEEMTETEFDNELLELIRKSDL